MADLCIYKKYVFFFLNGFQLFHIHFKTFNSRLLHSISFEKKMLLRTGLTINWGRALFRVQYLIQKLSEKPKIIFENKLIVKNLKMCNFKWNPKQQKRFTQECSVITLTVIQFLILLSLLWKCRFSIIEVHRCLIFL